MAERPIRSSKEPPTHYTNVSSTILSVARFYGAAMIHGHRYVYDSASDTLTRADIVADKIKTDRDAAKAKRRAAKAAFKAAQGDLGV